MNRRRLALATGLAVCAAGGTACGNDRTEAPSGRSTHAATTAEEPSAASRPPVTSWDGQRRLPFHFVKPPYVEFTDGSQGSRVGYWVTVRLNRRLHRVPKRKRPYPEQGGEVGPTRGSMRIDGYGGDIWPGLATDSFTEPCYSRNFDQGDDHAPPRLFPPYEGKLVTIALRVPGQRRIAVQVRAHRSTSPRGEAGLRRLGCEA